jgi:hypothetical protein
LDLLSLHPLPFQCSSHSTQPSQYTLFTNTISLTTHLTYAPSALVITTPNPDTATTLTVEINIPDLCFWEKGSKFVLKATTGSWVQAPYFQRLAIPRQLICTSVRDLFTFEFVIECRLLHSQPCNWQELTLPAPRAHDRSTVKTFSLTITSSQPIVPIHGAQYLTLDYFNHPDSARTDSGTHQVNIYPTQLACPSITNSAGSNSIKHSLIYPAHNAWLPKQNLQRQKLTGLQSSFTIWPLVTCPTTDSHFSQLLIRPTNPPLRVTNPTIHVADNYGNNFRLPKLGLSAVNWGWNGSTFGSKWTSAYNSGDFYPNSVSMLYSMKRTVPALGLLSDPICQSRLA